MNRQEYKLHYAPAGADLVGVLSNEGRQGWILCPVPVKKTIEHDIYVMRRPVDKLPDEVNQPATAGGELLMRCADLLEGFKNDSDKQQEIEDLISDIYKFVAGPAP